MELDIQYDKSLDCLVIEASGDITFKDLPTINEGVHAHEKFRYNIAQICNCSDGSLILTLDELRAFAKDAAEYALRFGEKRKLALVDSKPVNFGMMRQYQALLDTGPEVAIQVFKSMDDARDWIREG